MAQWWPVAGTNMEQPRFFIEEKSNCLDEKEVWLLLTVPASSLSCRVLFLPLLMGQEAVTMHGTVSQPSSNTCPQSQSQLVPASTAQLMLLDNILSPSCTSPPLFNPRAPEKYLFEWIWEDLASARHGGGEKKSSRMKRKRGSHHLDPAFTTAMRTPTKSYLILFIFMNLSYLKASSFS